MRNGTPIMDGQMRGQGWLYQETDGDDFLIGKTPKDLSETWEEE